MKEFDEKAAREEAARISELWWGITLEQGDMRAAFTLGAKWQHSQNASSQSAGLSEKELLQIKQAREMIAYPNYVPFMGSLLAIIDRLTGQAKENEDGKENRQRNSAKPDRLADVMRTHGRRGERR